MAASFLGTWRTPLLVASTVCRKLHQDELHAAESGIFGKAAKHDDISAPGKLAITIVIHKVAEQRPWDDYLSDEETRMKHAKEKPTVASALSVAYFPANRTTEELSARLLSPGAQSDHNDVGCKFVRSPQSRLSTSQWKEVLEAFRAYLLFGGSGGRTRRAAGAICVDSIQEAQSLHCHRRSKPSRVGSLHI